MTAQHLGLTVVLLAALALPACKPPPADASSARAANLPAARGPSEPIASPVVEGAVWAQSAKPDRIIYGVPGKPVLLALECLDAATPAAQLRITRHAPADKGAEALLALIGNGWIGRFEVDATAVRGQRVWQGDVPATRREWSALKPEREATVTVPGAGLLRLNPSPLPMQLVESCRKVEKPAAPAIPA
jgi:hypothetical protein